MPDLHQLCLWRRGYGAPVSGDTADVLFQPGVVVLAGHWDALTYGPMQSESSRYRAQESEFSATSADSQTSKLDHLMLEVLPECRRMFVTGPMNKSREQSTPRSPMLLASFKVQDWAIADHGVTLLRKITTYIEQLLPSTYHKTYWGLGHVDIVVMAWPETLHDGAIFLYKLRALTVDALDISRPESVRGENHLLKQSLSSFGFVFDDPSQLEESHSGPLKFVSTAECRTYPTLLCALHPGHEAAVTDLWRLFSLPLHDRTIIPNIEVVSGPFDIRVRYPGADALNTEHEACRWVFGVYAKLYMEDSELREKQHVRTLHTQWGGRLVGDFPFRDHSLPDAVRRATERRMSFGKEQLTPLGRFSRSLHVLERSPFFSRYLKDISLFERRAQAALRKAELAGEPIKPRQLAVLVERLTLMMTSRLPGATVGAEPQLVLGPAMALQKANFAFGYVADVLLSTFAGDNAAPLLVGTTPVDEAAISRVRLGHSNNSLHLVELEPTRDWRRSLVVLLHEVGHVVSESMFEEKEVLLAIGRDVATAVTRAAVHGEPFAALKTRVDGNLHDETVLRGAIFAALERNLALAFSNAEVAARTLRGVVEQQRAVTGGREGRRWRELERQAIGLRAQLQEQRRRIRTCDLLSTVELARLLGLRQLTTDEWLNTEHLNRVAVGNAELLSTVARECLADLLGLALLGEKLYLPILTNLITQRPNRLVSGDTVRGSEEGSPLRAVGIGDAVTCRLQCLKSAHSKVDVVGCENLARFLKECHVAMSQTIKQESDEQFVSLQHTLNVLQGAALEGRHNEMWPEVVSMFAAQMKRYLELSDDV